MLENSTITISFPHPLMKTHRPIFLSVLMALCVITHAQDTATPAPTAADAPAQTEMQKWIATTDAQWQAVFKRDVSDVHVTELEKLKQQYVAVLEAAVTKASGAGDLDGAVALRNEQKRIVGTNVFPEQDDAADAVNVKQIRAAIRAQIAKLEKDNAARAKALHAKYDQVLAQAQMQLTQRQRIEDALLVKAKREEVAAVWITPALAAAAAQAANAPASPPKGGDASQVLIGQWMFTWKQDGWTGKRTFNADGTLIVSDPRKKNVTGHWEITKDKVVATYGKGTKEEMQLPLRPSGTKVISSYKGREYEGVKSK